MGRMLRALKQLERQLPQASGGMEAAVVESESELDTIVPAVETALTETPDAFSAAVCQLAQAIAVLPEPVDLPVYPEIALSTPEIAGVGEVADDLHAAAVEDHEAAPETQRPSAAAQLELAEPYAGVARHIAGQLRECGAAAVTLVSLERTDPLVSMAVPLAVALASHFAPLLVVDCDLRAPMLAERFAVPVGPGLIDLLPGPARWQEVVRPTQYTGVDLLPGRHLVAADGRPPERLELASLVHEWLGRYRLVLLAAGPLGNPESGSLLRSSHAALLIVELGRTTQRAARKAARSIRATGAQLLGTVAVEAA
jgi:Mrp family chromosome partitioning ATPase